MGRLYVSVGITEEQKSSVTGREMWNYFVMFPKQIQIGADLKRNQFFWKVKNQPKRKIISHDQLFNVLNAYFCHCPVFYTEFSLSQADVFCQVLNVSIVSPKPNSLSSGDNLRKDSSTCLSGCLSSTLQCSSWKTSWMIHLLLALPWELH